MLSVSCYLRGQNIIIEEIYAGKNEKISIG